MRWYWYTLVSVVFLALALLTMKTNFYIELVFCIAAVVVSMYNFLRPENFEEDKHVPTQA